MSDGALPADAVRFRAGRAEVTFVRGDITLQAVDAIVNAANSSLMGGGGVDGAIHRAGGPSILEACRRIVAREGRCPAGGAVITGAGRLPARYVIHAVGPVWRGGGHGEPERLADAYRNALRLAEEHALASVAFPSIGTGAYRYPVALAAETAVGVVAERLEAAASVREVRFVLFSESDFRTYVAAARARLGDPIGP